ncbi:hypothetical protein DSL64_21975 [Dyadobacter luteus]|uniref:Uncharacterized protein n=1 Tax=Dyadobacter luteus TaxID=2259619 RepID=A0A3D8Y783_9BACT|nr:hypothetical protein DSL64_21975 [Dyadobacter luteus]
MPGWYLPNDYLQNDMLDGFIHANFKRKCGFSALAHADFTNLLIFFPSDPEKTVEKSWLRIAFLR